MTNHDLLAFAVAQEAVRQITLGSNPWNQILSPVSHITASRTWPVPDFVLVDPVNNVRMAAEFKPPRQSKREYLTGLGQAVAYSRDFHYGLLVIPEIADDGYPIAGHISSVLATAPFADTPVGLLVYDPSNLSPTRPSFRVERAVKRRLVPPAQLTELDQSIFAKWREMSPAEIAILLKHSYDEMQSSKPTPVRDRAFARLWTEIQAGTVRNSFAGIKRQYAPALRTAVSKNYRNFLFHIGWTEASGSLTKAGLNALHASTLYGSESRPFLDALARALLLAGKHLVFFKAISEFQDSVSPFPEKEPEWLDELETHLETKGLLKRNAARHLAAKKSQERRMLKAEKQLWKCLGLIIPRGDRYSFHKGRGLIFNWSRITELIQTDDRG